METASLAKIGYSNYTINTDAVVDNTTTKKILKPFLRENRLFVTLRLGKAKECIAVARLFAIAFIPNPNNYRYVFTSNPLNINADTVSWSKHGKSTDHINKLKTRYGIPDGYTSLASLGYGSYSINNDGKVRSQARKYDLISRLRPDGYYVNLYHTSGPNNYLSVASILYSLNNNCTEIYKDVFFIDGNYNNLHPDNLARKEEEVHMNNVDMQMELKKVKQFLKHPGDFLRAKLEKWELSQRDFASKTGISKTQVCQIITGVRFVKVETSMRFATVFGCEPLFWHEVQTQFEYEYMKHCKFKTKAKSKTSN